VNRGHSFRYWLFALLAHTAFNMAATFLVQYSNIWICEGVLLLLGLLSLAYVLHVRKSFPRENAYAF
ncbi:MAG: hypothetical protein ACLVDB_09770, partial [Anaeromassilibacillus sp.]